MAGERGTDPSMLEKDYVLGWILYGISESSIGQRLAFKGGTALSKVYYPGEWRFSEDLDFTALDSSEWDMTADALGGEVPEKVRRLSGMEIALRPKLHTNPRYLQARMRYVGPISRGTTKVDVTREGFLGSVEDVSVPAAFDCPEFTVRAYTVETILAEKMRSIIQRGHVRDYYDVWRLLGERPSRGVADMFVKKMQGRRSRLFRHGTVLSGEPGGEPKGVCRDWPCQTRRAGYALRRRDAVRAQGVT